MAVVAVIARAPTSGAATGDAVACAHMLRSLVVLALFACSCGGTGEPAAPQPEAAKTSAPVDDAKRKSVLEVAGKVDAIRTAAAAQDFDALAKQMCDDFDFGGPTRGRDAALASWRADPQRLAALVRAIDGDCALDESAGVHWNCRPRAGTPAGTPEDAARELVSLGHDERGWSWCVFSPRADVARSPS